jgi:transcriptional regulator with XRE-family HTH domain
MAITNTLNFNQRQLRAFARLFREARLRAGMTQLEVAQAAFEYKKSHCKVSRVERCAMPKVDAHCLERMAIVLNVPRRQLEAVDPKFNARAAVAREATRRGFWTHLAAA